MFFFVFLQGLNGFIMMTTQTGKLLYISDNAAEYLGHSMVSGTELGVILISIVVRKSYSEHLT